MRLLKDIRTWMRLRASVHRPWSLVRTHRDPVDEPTCAIRLRDGGTLTLRTSTKDRSVFLHVWGRDEYRLEDLERDGAGTVVDVGAHVGIFATRAATFARRVISFEPAPANFAMLVENVRRFPNVTPVPKAVTDKRGSAEIHVFGEPSSNSIFGSHGKGPGEAVSVETTTLADVFADYAIDRCDLLKLDCEGAEYPVIFGAPPEIWSRVRRVAMEFHGVDAGQPSWTGDGLAAYLRSRGHDVELRPRSRHPWKGLLYSELKHAAP